MSTAPQTQRCLFIQCYRRLLLWKFTPFLKHATNKDIHCNLLLFLLRLLSFIFIKDIFISSLVGWLEIVFFKWNFGIHLGEHQKGFENFIQISWLNWSSWYFCLRCEILLLLLTIPLLGVLDIIIKILFYFYFYFFIT